VWQEARILKLDASGTARKWIDFNKLANYHANGKVLWTLGSQRVASGGQGRQGSRSTIEVPSIVAVRGVPPVKLRPVIRVCKRALVLRDRHMCAYCGGTFRLDRLTIEHIMPHARGGRLIWTNIVSACKPCNSRKACRTPEEAKMPLLYVPYVPDPFEGLILTNRRILADQMDFLMARVESQSRLRA
jgi:hypothetical protein